MDGARISSNTATSNTYGGGVYQDDGTFNLDSGTIIGNSAANRGGGIYFGSLAASPAFGSGPGAISGNTAPTGQSIYNNKTSPITISGGGNIITGEDGAITWP